VVPSVVPPALDGSVIVRKSGLVFSRVVPYRKWEMIGQQLLAVANSSTWWIADWLAYGESAYQGRYQEAAQKTSLKYQTLRNYAWVARRFELSRRRDSLSFGHHAEVSALDQPEQDYWLRKAEELGWSRNQVRQQVRNSLRERRAEEAAAVGGARQQEDDTTVSLRLTDEQFSRFTAAATSNNLGLDEWAVRVLDGAVHV
jgi:hypothetical protein